MQKHKITQKIGSWILLFLIIVLSAEFMGLNHAISFSLAQASSSGGAVEFTAQVDQNRIGVDETLTLRMMIQSDGRGNTGQPRFHAPDFDVVQQSSSVSMRSEYDSTAGRFSTVNQTEVIRVLQPKGKGKFKISGIEIRSDAQTLRAPDIQVEVTDAVGQQPPSSLSLKGGHTPHSRFRSQNAAAEAGTDAPFVLRAEIDHDRAYKGEQVRVNYYLYYQGKILNMEVQKFPELVGFLREDLALPVMGQRLSAEMASLNGIPYFKSLLLSYAIYPLQEGPLLIDPLSVKYEYISSRKKGRSEGEEEDFFLQFFQPMMPQTGLLKSESKTLQVLPLPEAGKPSSFTGGVGEFSVLSAVNQYEVHAHEALTLTLKVDGKGNLPSLKEPQIHWPASIDVYDSKARVIHSQGIGGSKIFEFLLIPRVPGNYTLPRIELGFFNSRTQSYEVKSTEPISIRVLPPLPGTSNTPPAGLPSQSSQTGSPQQASAPQLSSSVSLRGIKPPQLTDGEEFWHPLWRIFYWLFCIAFTGWVILVLKDWIKSLAQKRGKKDAVGSSRHGVIREELQRFAQTLRSSPEGEDSGLLYQQISDFLMNRMDEQLSLNSRALSRGELQEKFQEALPGGLKHWTAMEKVLDQLDQIKYSGGMLKASLKESLAVSLEALGQVWSELDQNEI